MERSTFKGNPERISFSIQWRAANPPADAVTDCVLPQGAAGYVVPAGYRFHPAALFAVSNAALTAGTADFNITADGVELSLGSAQLNDAVQTVSRVFGFDAEPINAGVVIGTSITTSAGYLPITADHNIVVIGELVAENYRG